MAMKNIVVLFLLTGTMTALAYLPDVSGIASNVLERVQQQLAGVSNSSAQGRFFAGGGYGGCTDSFSVFGFLAFLLALLDLILDLQAANANNNGGGRSIRSSGGGEGDWIWRPGCQDNAEMQQATSACYSLLRGFLNALAAEDPNCAQRFMCEGAEEAATAGPIGEVIANVASLNAGSWLQKVNSTMFEGVGEAGRRGAANTGDCAFRYSKCYALPAAYRYPAVYRGPQLPSEAYQPVFQEMMEVVKNTLLR